VSGVRTGGRTVLGASAGTWLLRLVLLGTAVMFTYPLLWLVSASLKPRSDVFDDKLVPDIFAPENYAKLWAEIPLLTWLTNSLVVGLAAAVAVTLSSALVAFGFAYFQFPGRRWLFGLVLATMMLPGAVTLIPTYLIWNGLGLVGTQIPLWAQNLFGSAFYIFLLRQFFLGLPRELFEAARVDGAGYFRMFRSVAVPLTLPALIVVLIFELKASWTDLMKPLIFLKDLDLFTLPRGLKYVVDSFNPQTGGQGEFHLVMAASVIITLPMVVIFFLAQRYFVEGIATTGSKG
jgi:multiple sugar transport system permease protein